MEYSLVCFVYCQEFWNPNFCFSGPFNLFFFSPNLLRSDEVTSFVTVYQTFACSVQCRWYLCALEIQYARQTVSQKFRQRCLLREFQCWSNFWLTMALSSSFPGRSPNTSPVYASLLQAIDGVTSSMRSMVWRPRFRVRSGCLKLLNTSALPWHTPFVMVALPASLSITCDVMWSVSPWYDLRSWLGVKYYVPSSSSSVPLPSLAKTILQGTVKGRRRQGRQRKR